MIRLLVVTELIVSGTQCKTLQLVTVFGRVWWGRGMVFHPFCESEEALDL